NWRPSAISVGFHPELHFDLPSFYGCKVTRRARRDSNDRRGTDRYWDVLPSRQQPAWEEYIHSPVNGFAVLAAIGPVLRQLPLAIRLCALAIRPGLPRHGFVPSCARTRALQTIVRVERQLGVTAAGS